MSTRDPFEPTYDLRKYEMVAQLEKIGPRVSTSVMVNGRSLLLDAAIRIVEQMPDEIRRGRRGIHIFIDPDPFARPDAASVTAAAAGNSERNAEMLSRLIERQNETDRLAEEERRGSVWWRKLLRLLTGRS